MKNFKFINQSLWAGSSPNQTGETLTRENRIGVKSWLNRGLMLLITILTLGVGQMWAETRRYYCKMTYSWWTTGDESGNAAIGAYAWKSSDATQKNANYPGVRMTWTGNDGEWYIDLDTKYDRVIFTRVNGSGDIKDWGAKTGDLTLGDNNYYTITQSTAEWSGTCSGDWSKYAPTPAVEGGWNSWRPDKDVFSGTSGTVTCSITLPANTEYQFKIFHGTDQYGYGASDGALTFKRQLTNQTLSNSGRNIKIRTSCAGTYTFTYNTSSHQLSISYPNSKKVYFYKYGASWDKVYAHVYNDDTWKMDNWPGIEITSNYEHGTYYINTDGYTYVIFNNGENPGTQGSTKTSTITIGDNNGKCIIGPSGTTWQTLPPSISGVWKYFPGQTITLTATEYGGGRSCTYQWQKHNGSSYANITGANTATYTKSNCAASDAGKYRCVVTYSDNSEVAYSCGDTEDGYQVKVLTLKIADQSEGEPYPSYDITLTSGTTGTVSVPLSAATKYYFEVFDNISTYYGNTGFIIQDMSSAEGCGAGSGRYRLFAGPAGDYTFTIDIDHLGDNYVTVAVSYPTVSHPVAGYNYFEKVGDWSGSYYVYWWYNDGSDHGLTAWKESPQITTETRICGTDYIYFPVISQYNKLIVKDDNNDVPAHQTPGDAEALISTAGSGKYFNFTNGAWTAFNVHTITFAGNENTGGSMTNVYPVCNTSNQTLAANGFTRTGYSFANWTANVDVTINSATVKAGNAIANQATIQNITSDITLTAQWNPVELTFDNNGGSGDGNWSTETNWDPECVPTIAHDVVIEAPVTVDINNARAKSVVIYNNGSSKTGQLNIGAAKELVIATTLNKTTTGSNTVATDENDLIIGSSASGNGALVIGEYSVANQATVAFYSKSCYDAETPANSVNQYVGIPFNSGTVLGCFYDSWVYQMDYDANPIAWKRTEGSLSPFTGYSVIYNGSAGHTYWMDGTLVPTSNKTCSGLHYDSGSGAANWNNENLLANSWTAPIKIKALAGAFTNADATIYIFNSGSPSDYKDASKTGSGAAQYSTYTVGSAGETDAIPSMQSFSVFTTAESGSLTLNYSTIVYNPAVAAVNRITPVANRAPKRTAEEMDKVRIYVEGESGYRDMIYMLEDETQFTEGFDNGWDGRKLFGLDVAPQFYALSTDGNMAVAAVPDMDGTVLGFKAGNKDSQYTISFDYAGTSDLYLYDIDAMKETLVDNENTYVFTTSDEVAHNRFVLSKVSKMPTGVENTSSEMKTIKFIENGELFILRDGKLYNVMGTAVK